MEYAKGYVYELMDKGGPTNVMEPYFMEAVDEMMRARTLCAKANALLPDDLSYHQRKNQLMNKSLRLRQRIMEHPKKRRKKQ